MTTKTLPAFALAAVAIVVWAGEPSTDGEPADDLADLSLKELLALDVRIVRSASKYYQKVTEAPSSVTVVSADEIKKYGHRTLADILRSVRGLYVSYDRHYHYLGVRGFNRPGDYDTRILLLVDGHRVNDNIYDAPQIGTEFLLDVDNIDRVEIVRGPSSSLYGSNALLAVINVITKQGSDLKGTELSVQAGRWDTYKGRLTYGNQFGSGLELIVSGSVYDSGGHRRLYFERFDRPARNDGVAEDADDDGSYNLFAKLSYEGLSVQAAYASREKKVPTASFGTEFNDSRTETTEDRGYLDLSFEHEVASRLTMTARLYYDYWHYDGDYVYDYGRRRTRLVVNKDEARGQWWGTELMFMKDFERGSLGKHRLTWGAEFRHNFQQDQKNYDEDVYLSDDRDSKIWALYAEDAFQLLDNLTLSAGVRHDNYDTFGGTTNPRVGLIYDPTQAMTLKLLYGRAFRAPIAYELYYEDGESMKPNPDLDPETIETYELVMEHRLSRHLSLTASTFYYQMDDIISQERDPADRLLAYRNKDEATGRGAELELEGRWDNGVNGRVSYTFVQTHDKETRRALLNSPRHVAKLNLTVPLVADKVFTGLEAQFTDRRRSEREGDAGSYCLVNLTLLCQELWPGLELSASVYNVLDTEYDDPASGEHRQDVLEQDGRNFRVQLTYKF